VSATLIAARDKIAAPERWCKGTYARPDSHSERELEPRDPRAGAWCALGALAYVDGPYEEAASKTLAEVITDWPHARAGAVYVYNDDPMTRHRDIMAKFNKAIKLAQSREAMATQQVTA
jgi:hypothetical protein